MRCSFDVNLVPRIALNNLDKMYCTENVFKATESHFREIDGKNVFIDSLESTFDR